MTFLDVWIGYAIFGTATFSAMFVWAVRTRQFSDFERGRRIALKGSKESEWVNQRTSRADKIGLAVLFLVTFTLLAAAVFIGWRMKKSAVSRQQSAVSYQSTADIISRFRG